MIPSQVRHRRFEGLRHYDDAGECMFCYMVERAVEDQTRVALKSERCVAMEVFASATPFATHIFPLRHMASFGDISETEVVDLARVLRTLLAKIYVGLENPDLNFTVRSGPAEYAGARYFHWYVSVIPRLTRVAGFELGSGMFINTVLPEAAAEFLRKVALEKVAGSRGGTVVLLEIRCQAIRGWQGFLSPLPGLADFLVTTRVLRPFGKLTASCGPHSCAASRLSH